MEASTFDEPFLIYSYLEENKVSNGHTYNLLSFTFMRYAQGTYSFDIIMCMGIKLYTQV
jgi:hypothetical protein